MEADDMIELEEMGSTEMQSFIQRVGYGHLGCSRNDHPYVVPIQYVYAANEIYFITSEGQKTDFIATNPEVCLQIEEVQNPSNWRSVIVIGKAERLTKQEDTERAMQYLTETNPTLTPAISKMWIAPWGRATTVAIYRIRPAEINGRKTIPEGESRGPRAYYKSESG